MKQVVSAFVMAALVGLAVGAQADERQSHGYINADIKGGYGCNLIGTVGRAGAVGTAQYHPQGDGTFSEAVLALHIGNIGVCQYSLEPGTGTYDVSANGTGLAQAIYSLQMGSAERCPTEFSSPITFVCSGAVTTADTCDIAILDTGVLLSGTCKKAEEEAPVAALDAALEKSFEQSAAPGVVAAVQTPEYTWVRALGVADRTSEEPMTPDVHHRIGSATKTFTVSLLLQAADEGLLSLDDTIERYVEGVPNGDEITLRQLANMTSGIATYNTEQFEAELSSDPYRVWQPEELVQFGIEDSPLFDPGTEWQYSNINTLIIGLVLEQVTGEAIGQLYRERIIEPLGLKGTSFPDLADNSLPDPHAQGYTLSYSGQSSGEEPTDVTDWNPSFAGTAGAMISTIDDLLVYGRALGTGEGLLSPEQQAERLDSFVRDLPPLNQPPFNGNLSYGLGLFDDHGWIGHPGEVPGFTTILYYHPDLDAVVAVEANSDISAGDCPDDRPTMTDGPEDIPCADPVGPIFRALAEALGKPAPPLQ